MLSTGRGAHRLRISGSTGMTLLDSTIVAHAGENTTIVLTGKGGVYRGLAAEIMHARRYQIDSASRTLDLVMLADTTGHLMRIRSGEILNTIISPKKSVEL